MLKILATYVAALCLSTGSIQAKQLLEDLDFESGNWDMVGVSLVNHKPVEIQDQIGTFIVRESHILRQMQAKWDFEPTFEDYCDYHYALKFYKDGNLEKTLRVNLVCNYITDGAFSYRFSPDLFVEYKRYYVPIRWSRIRFKDLDLLHNAVAKIDLMPGIYWYGDVQQYNFDGEFSISVRDLPWNASRDSVIQVQTERISSETGREDFYITEKYWLLSPDFEKMELRLNIYCNQDLYKAYSGNDVMTWWRSHFSEQSFVQIMVIGLSKEEFFSRVE